MDIPNPISVVYKPDFSNPIILTMSSSYYHPHEQRLIYYIPQYHHHDLSTSYLQIPIMAHNQKQPSVIAYPAYGYPLPNQHQYTHARPNQPTQHKAYHTYENNTINQQRSSPIYEQTTHDLRNRLHHRRYQHALLREGLRRRLHIRDLLFLLGHRYRYSLDMRGGNIGMFSFPFWEVKLIGICVCVLIGS